MKFTIELSKDERRSLIRGILDQEFNINCEISELAGIDLQWAKDEIIVLEEKRKQLRILAIKIEG
jgi:hypothetical protein